MGKRFQESVTLLASSSPRARAARRLRDSITHGELRPGEKLASEVSLAKRLGVSPPAVSQHLRILRDAGLVTPEKRGYYVHYRLDDKTLKTWRQRTDELLHLKQANARPCAVRSANTKGEGPCRTKRRGA